MLYYAIGKKSRAVTKIFNLANPLPLSDAIAAEKGVLACEIQRSSKP